MRFVKFGFKFNGFFIVFDGQVQLILILINLAQGQAGVRGVSDKAEHLVIVEDSIFIDMRPSPWKNETALTDKLRWVKKYLGKVAHKRVIFSHHKNLNCGDFLIDDRDDKNGVDKFQGEHIHFGNDDFPNWESVVTYLEGKEKADVPRVICRKENK